MLLYRQAAKAEEFATGLMAQAGNGQLEVATHEVDVRSFSDLALAVKEMKDMYETH